MLRIFIIGIINSILVVQLHNVIQAHTQLDKRSLKRAFLLMLIQSKIAITFCWFIVVVIVGGAVGVGVVVLPCTV